MCSQQLGCYNVAIGNCIQLPSTTTGCQLAIGFCTNCYWLTGCSNRNIRVHANIVDSAGNAGAAPTTFGCQVLTTNGTGVVWATVCDSPMQVSCALRGYANTLSPIGNVGSIQIDDLYFGWWSGCKMLIMATSNSCNNNYVVNTNYQLIGGQTGISCTFYQIPVNTWRYLANNTVWSLNSAGDIQEANIHIMCAANTNCGLCAYKVWSMVGHGFLYNPICVTRIY